MHIHVQINTTHPHTQCHTDTHTYKHTYIPVHIYIHTNTYVTHECKHMHPHSNTYGRHMTCPSHYVHICSVYNNTRHKGALCLKAKTTEVIEDQVVDLWSSFANPPPHRGHATYGVDRLILCSNSSQKDQVKTLSQESEITNNSHRPTTNTLTYAR